MSPEDLSQTLREENLRLRKQIDDAIAYSKNPEVLKPLFEQQQFILNMMERLTTGGGPKTAWERLQNG